MPCADVTQISSACRQLCIIQLQKQNSELARTLAEVLECRVKDRYGLHASVLQYLHSPSARSPATDVFRVPLPGKDIKTFIRRLVCRLEDSDKSTAGGTTSAEDNKILQVRVRCLLNYAKFLA